MSPTGIAKVSIGEKKKRRATAVVQGFRDFLLFFLGGGVITLFCMVWAFRAGGGGFGGFGDCACKLLIQQPRDLDVN